MQAHGPAQGIQNARIQTAALAELALRQNFGLPGDSRDASGVVRQCTENAGNPSSVPRAVFNSTAGESSGGCVGSRDPVTGIGSVCIATIAVVGDILFVFVL